MHWSLPKFVFLLSFFFSFLPFEVRAVVNYRVWRVFTAVSSRLSHHRRPLFNQLTSTLVKNAPLLTAVQFQPGYSCVFLQNMFIILSLTSTLGLRYFLCQPERSYSAQIYSQWLDVWYISRLKSKGFLPTWKASFCRHGLRLILD